MSTLGERMQEPRITAEGGNGRIALLQDRVLIQRQEGSAKRSEVSREIPIRYIASVEYKANFFDGGCLRLMLGGQGESGWFWKASKDPYTVVFTWWDRKPFEALRQAIDQRIALRQGPAEVPDSIPALQVPAVPKKARTDAGTLDVVVDGTPESCLARIEAYLEHDWPHGGHYGRPLVNKSTVNIAEYKPRKRYLIDSATGLLLLLVLSIITAGAFLAIYFIYYILMDTADSNKSNVLAKARIVATVEKHNQTRLSVSASRKDWAQTLEGWVQRELVQNRAAAWGTSQEQQSASDVPEQIKKLAELRDARAISNEEFEAKKRDLLDRM